MELHFLMIFKWMRVWVFLTTWKYLNNLIISIGNRSDIQIIQQLFIWNFLKQMYYVFEQLVILKVILLFKKGASDGLSFFLFFFYTLNIFYVSVRQKYSVKSFSMFSVTVLFHSGHDCLKHGSFSALLLVNSHFLSFLLFQQLLSVPRL